MKIDKTQRLDQNREQLLTYKVFGKQIHLTVEPESWWIEKISKYGEVEIFEGKSSMKDRKGNIRKYKNVRYIHCVLGK